MGTCRWQILSYLIRDCSSRSACVSVVSLCSNWLFLLKPLEHWFLGGWPLATSLHGQGGEYFFSHLLAFPPLITTEWNGAVTPDIGVSCASQDLGLAVWGPRPVK